MVILKWKEPKQKRRQSPNLGPEAKSNPSKPSSPFPCSPLPPPRVALRWSSAVPRVARRALSSSRQAACHASPSEEASRAASLQPPSFARSTSAPRVSTARSRRATFPTRPTRLIPSACHVQLLSPHAQHVFSSSNGTSTRVLFQQKKKPLLHDFQSMIYHFGAYLHYK